PGRGGNHQSSDAGRSGSAAQDPSRPGRAGAEVGGWPDGHAVSVLRASPKSSVATGATAGTPGTWTPSGSTARANLAAMPGCVANPATPWTTGQRMVLGDANLTSWSGTSWVGGAAP